MPVTWQALKQEAYVFAVREYHALNYTGTLNQRQYDILMGLVGRHLLRLFPRWSEAERLAAADAGVALAISALANPEIGGFVGAVGRVIEPVLGTVEAGAEVVEHAAVSTVKAVEHTAVGVIHEIERAVELPFHALPVKIPTGVTQAFATLGHQLGTVLPTNLGKVNRLRVRIRRLGL